MCGIAGFWSNENVNDNDITLVKNMNKTQEHRGPDDEGIYINNNIILGHRRLSIIDLSLAGHQPMEYEDKYTICFNGEIYNYIELKEELKSVGYKFKSNTDTEVVMLAYDYWGTECFNKFNGFWAFALYLKESEELILSRDRYGVKPLYYHLTDDRLLFASEIKAILCDSKIERKVNDNVVVDYLVNGLVNFNNETFFSDVYCLPAAAYMKINKNLEFNIYEYYDVDFTDDISPSISDKEIEEFRRLFDSSIRFRMRSDVKVGSCLSGGLDSSAVVCHIDNYLKEKGISNMQETFSACYTKDFKLDESEYIDEVINATNVNSNKIYPTAEMFNEDFDKLIYAQDEPFGSAGIFASYCVMRLANEKGVKVLLDGQGADELLCGYRKSRLYYIKILIKNKKYFKALKEMMFSFSQFKTSQNFLTDFSKIKQVLGISKKEDTKNKYLSSYIKNKEQNYDYNNKDNFLKNDLTKISVPALLRYADRNSMAFSVEDRLPYLDYEFVNYVALLPLSMKIHNGVSKYIMREALILPEKIKNRKSKIGFAVPEDEWIKQYSKEFLELFKSEDFRASKYIDNKKIVENWDELINNEDSSVVFRFICLEKWMRIFSVK